jgi:aromatic ring-opening dioxygenase catalytic subunit (LigB family)
MQMGRALMKLRDENVLIIGSGMSFHNMRAYGDTRFSAVSDAFDEWLTNAVESEAAERAQQLRAWGEAPHAQLCHPQGGEEHLIPLMVAAGAAGDSQGRKIYSERVMQTTISAFQFG